MAETTVFVFVLGLCLSSSIVFGSTFSNTWAVNIRGGPVVLERLARKLGFVNETQVGGYFFPDHNYIFASV